MSAAAVIVDDEEGAEDDDDGGGADDASRGLVEEALRTARYNEIVQLSIGGGGGGGASPSREEIALVPALDETNGGIAWKRLNSAGDGSDEENRRLLLERYLQTKRWMFPMLNDRRRNELYQKAIDGACRKLLLLLQREREEDDNSSSMKPRRRPITVVDIGSGTGLLSMMVARSLLSSSNQKREDGDRVQRFQVHSVEMSSAMSDLAGMTIRDNHLDGVVTVTTGHSTSLRIAADDDDDDHEEEGDNESAPRPLPCRADLCVSELLESGLLGEGLLPALRDARQRLLRYESAITIPQAALVFVAAVRSDFLREMFRCTRTSTTPTRAPKEDKEAQELTGALCLAVVDGMGGLFSEDDPYPVLPVHADKLLRDGRLTLLTDPVQILEFDLQQLNNDAPEGSAERTVSATARHGGTVDALLVWWDLDLWSEEETDADGNVGDSNPTATAATAATLMTLTYSMKPGAEPWQDHWHQCLHLLPSMFDRDDCSRAIKRGESVTIRASHDDARIHVSVIDEGEECQRQSNGKDGTVTREKKRPRTEHRPSSSSSSLLSTERVLQLLDRDRTLFHARAVLGAVSRTGKDDAKVLDLSDFSLCACLAALAGCKRVVCLESGSDPELALLSAKVAQIGNGLPLDGAHFEVLQCHAEQLTLDLVGGGAPANIVVAEPYYNVLEGWHLQEALNYYYLVRSLRIKGLIAEDACVVPATCRIMGCAIESKQLRSAYRSCGDDGESEGASTEKALVCGFDHSAINRYGDRFDKFDLSLPLWQYDYKRLTDDWELARLDFERPAQGSIRSKTRASFREAGSFDALMVWLEYGSGAHTLSTDRCLYRQCVRMMRRPVAIQLPVGATSTAPPRVHIATQFGGLNQDHGGSTIMDHQFVVTVEREPP